MKRVSKKFIKNFNAEDITTLSFEEYSKIKCYDKLYVSTGTFGINGGIFKDYEGNLYKIIARSSTLFYFF